MQKCLFERRVYPIFLQNLRPLTQKRKGKSDALVMARIPTGLESWLCSSLRLGTHFPARNKDSLLTYN